MGHNNRNIQIVDDSSDIPKRVKHCLSVSGFAVAVLKASPAPYDDVIWQPYDELAPMAKTGTEEPFWSKSWRKKKKGK